MNRRLLRSIDIGKPYVRTWKERRGERRRTGGHEAVEGHRDRAEDVVASYYGVPAIHKPHWDWKITGYFFLGGLSGASFVLSSFCDLFGGGRYDGVARHGRYIAIAALVPGSGLLIADLGRPERFLNMFRVMKFRSPMSIGSWGLGVFGAIASAAAAAQLAEDGRIGSGAPADLLLLLPTTSTNVAGMVSGFFVSGYTGVLLAATAVPIWAKNWQLMGPLFIAASMCSAVGMAKITGAIFGTTDRELKMLSKVEQASAVLELGILVASYLRLQSTSRPALEGRNGTLLLLGTIGGGLIAAPVIDLINRRSHRRGPAAFSGALSLAGGLILRHVVVDSGSISADDPAATFALASKSA